MSQTTREAKAPPDAEKDEPLKADYRGATPKQVAEAVLRYRGSGKPIRPIRKRRKTHPEINPGI